MDNQFPKKRWGQHFLTDKNIACKIVAAAVEHPPPLLILEIGPGTGVLTELLIPAASQYLGIEIDPSLAKTLRERYASMQNVRILVSDFLEIDLAKILKPFTGLHTVVVGNIPYNITSPILFKIFENADRINEAVLMMQKEVAQRLVAQPGSKEYGLLAINTQLFTEVKYLFTVAAHLFYPAPKVESAVVRMKLKCNVPQMFSDFALFRQVTRYCFRHRRKMLRKSLSMLFSPDLVRTLSADLTQRPEELSIDEWKELCEMIHQQVVKGSAI